MLIFAVQSQRENSECDPINGFIRVHEWSSPYGHWTSGREKGQPEKTQVISGQC